jgi:glutamate-1-semialdehyde 2,1-aminomutase
LRDTPDLYGKLNRAGDEFFTALDGILDKAGVPHCTNHIGSLGCVFFTPEKVRDYAGAQTSDTSRYTSYFKHMLDSGVYLAPSQFEAMFLSTAHTSEDLQKTLNAVREFVK